MSRNSWAVQLTAPQGLGMTPRDKLLGSQRLLPALWGHSEDSIFGLSLVVTAGQR